MSSYTWQGREKVPTESFTCGYCGSSVACSYGFRAEYSEVGSPYALSVFAYDCPQCGNLTLFDSEKRQRPGPLVVSLVDHLPPEVKQLWDEAIFCMSAGSSTAASMVCRVLLMHVAVDKGADGGSSFATCVDWLVNHGYFSPDAKSPLDRVRKIGNTANHDLQVIDCETARKAMRLTEHLLKSVYEIPGHEGDASEV